MEAGGGGIVELIINIVTPPITLLILFFFCLPTLYHWRSIVSTFRTIFPENLTGKVVLITGASSGIGEHVAYEYAKRGACLALVARRYNRLREVAERAERLGSPHAVVIPADVCSLEDNKRLVDQTLNHFGRLDHLVTNAGITPMMTVEEATDMKVISRVMETNFWGSVYATHFALPHLKRSHGKIVVVGSSARWLCPPRMGFYSASKAAIMSFYETLRIELKGKIGITIVTPGLIESEMTKGKFLSKDGNMIVDQDLRDVQASILPIQPVEVCAKAIVNSARRGDEGLVTPSWIRQTLLWQAFVPEIVNWFKFIFLMTPPGIHTNQALGKILDISGAKKFLYPSSTLSPEI